MPVEAHSSSETVMDPLTATYYDVSEKTWHGPKCKPLYNEDMTLGEVMYQSLKKNPDKIIQIHDQTGEKLSCAELLEYSENLSRSLIKLGLKPGDVIGLYANNWTHVTTVMLASFLCGTPVNSIFPNCAKELTSVFFNISKPKIIFCEVANFAVAAEVEKDLNLKAPIFILNGQMDGVPNVQDLLKVDQDMAEKEKFRFPCLDLEGDDTAFILYSSGTTGIPKGISGSNRALLNQKIYLTLKSDSVLFTFSNISWASGLWTLIASLLHANLRIITTKAFTAEYFLQLVRQYKITHLLSVSQHMLQLDSSENIKPEDIQKSFESIDTILVGGYKVSLIVQENMNAILENSKKRPGLTVAYGLSELAGMVSMSGGYPLQRLEGSEGKLMANCMVRIISKDGARLGPMEHGEICVQTPYKWLGYYNNPEATLKTLRHNWLHTGDVGYFDEQGFLHVCARDNDVFRSMGLRLYPSRIEDVVQQLPGISQTCVVGIPDLSAQNLIACVVVRASNTNGINLTAEKIDQHVQCRMGILFKLTGGVYFVDSFPKTGSGKVQRQKVLDMILKIREGSDNKNIEN